jgi:radical SAM superfamily enzyme YgiQ (UPF0313 family)
MGGIPGETEEDFSETIDLIQWIKTIYPIASVRLFRFIPYPKMPILVAAVFKIPNFTGLNVPTLVVF